MAEDKAVQIVNAILHDLTGRRGLRHEWDGIDDDIQQEIRDTWATIVRKELGIAEHDDSDSTGFK